MQDQLRNPYLTQTSMDVFCQICMHVYAPETHNNTPNPRKSDFFHNISPLTVEDSRIAAIPLTWGIFRLHLLVCLLCGLTVVLLQCAQMFPVLLCINSI